MTQLAPTSLHDYLLSDGTTEPAWHSLAGLSFVQATGVDIVQPGDAGVSACHSYHSDMSVNVVRMSGGVCMSGDVCMLGDLCMFHMMQRPTVCVAA